MRGGKNGESQSSFSASLRGYYLPERDPIVSSVTRSVITSGIPVIDFASADDTARCRSRRGFIDRAIIRRDFLILNIYHTGNYDPESNLRQGDLQIILTSVFSRLRLEFLLVTVFNSLAAK